MSKEVYIVQILVDRINNKLVATPIVVHTILVGEYEHSYVVQRSLTNGHLKQVQKSWLFYDEASAQEYIANNREYLESQCDDIIEAMERNWS